MSRAVQNLVGHQCIVFIAFAFPLSLLQTSSVPCWMFIGWIGQMLALLDKPEAKGVVGIVETIAKEYPQVRVNLF